MWFKYYENNKNQVIEKIKKDKEIIIEEIKKTPIKINSPEEFLDSLIKRTLEHFYSGLKKFKEGYLEGAIIDCDNAIKSYKVIELKNTNKLQLNQTKIKDL